MKSVYSSRKVDGRNGRLVSNDELVRRREELLMVKAFHRNVDVVNAAAASRVWHLSDGRDRDLLLAVVHADQALVGPADLKIIQNFFQPYTLSLWSQFVVLSF